MIRSWRGGLAAIMAVAAGARIALIVATPHFTLFGDPSDYQRWAVSLATGHGFPTTIIASPGTPSAYRPPAYPLALAAVYAVLGVHPVAGRALGVLLGTASVALVAVLGRELWGPRVGLIAGAIAAVFPPLVELNGTLVSESLFVPLELCFALALLAAVRRPRQARWAALAGALCALCALTRAVADVWILVAVAAVACAPGIGRARSRSVAALIAAFAVVVAPWTIRNAVVLHAFVPGSTEGGYTLAGQYNATVAAPGPFQAVWQIPLIVPSVAARLAPLYHRPGGVNEAQLDAALRTIGWRYLGAHPAVGARAVVDNTLRLLDLGPGHTFYTGIIDRELSLPGVLRTPTSLSAQLVALLGVLGLAVAVVPCLRRRERREGREPRERWGRRDGLGPWWLWVLPLSLLVVTVPVVGGPVKRAPLDPFLILLAAIAVAALNAYRQGADKSLRTSEGQSPDERT